MYRTKKKRLRKARKSVTTVGIDVGGERKGFHAVAITDGQYSGHFTTGDETALDRWCRLTVKAHVVAVDAPCRWSTDDRSRPAERELMGLGIWCFSTPTRRRAVEHRTNHYGWMLRGESLFGILEQTYPLCDRHPFRSGSKFCFETFPHAITWHLRDGAADASRKRQQRRGVLAAEGIDLTEVTNIDFVDAALCALTAYYAATGRECVSFGERDTGLIIVPTRATP